MLGPKRREETYEDSGRSQRKGLQCVRASADTSVQEHGHFAGGGLHDLLQSRDGGGYVVELSGAVVRDDDPGAAALDGQLGVLGGDHTLDEDGHAGDGLQPLDVLPAQRLVDLTGHVGRKTGVLGFLHLSEVQTLEVLQRQMRRKRKPVLDVRFTATENRSVDRECDRREPCLFRPADELRHHIAVLVHVELEESNARSGAGDLLHAAGSPRRQGLRRHKAAGAGQ